MSAPEPYWAGDGVTLYHGDCIEVTAGLDAASVDAVVTDPPYGLEFMGKDWDGADGFRRSLNPADAGRDDVFGRASRTAPEYRTKPASAQMRTRQDDRTNPQSGKSTVTVPEAYVAGNLYQEWCTAWAAECLRVLKPGGHLLAFGGTRTYHRLACGVEDAGFEVRDSMHWIYGSGFPKSLDVSKAIDKAAGAEREVIGPKTFADGTSARRTQRLGTGVFSDPESRDSNLTVTAPATEDAARWNGWGTALKPAHEPIIVARKPLAGTVAGNVLAYGTGALNIDACRVEAAPRPLVVSDRRTGNQTYGDGLQGSRAAGTTDTGRWPPNVLLGPDAAAELDQQSGVLTSGALQPYSERHDNASSYRLAREKTYRKAADSGGASRFFPVFRYQAKAGSAARPRGDDGTAHPTVKPLDLMRWLVRLVTPPGGLVLDPFAGSGTTAEACIVEGFRCVLIEKDQPYAELIRKRLDKPIQPVMFGVPA